MNINIRKYDSLFCFAEENRRSTLFFLAISGIVWYNMNTAIYAGGKQ